MHRCYILVKIKKNLRDDVLLTALYFFIAAAQMAYQSEFQTSQQN